MSKSTVTIATTPICPLCQDKVSPVPAMMLTIKVPPEATEELQRVADEFADNVKDIRLKYGLVSLRTFTVA